MRALRLLTAVGVLGLGACASTPPPNRSQQPSADKLPIVETCVDADAKITRTQVIRSSG